MHLVLHVDDVRLGHCTDTTRVPAQWSITIDSTVGSLQNFFQEFPEAVFAWGSLKSVLHSDDVWSGNSTDTTRVPT